MPYISFFLARSSPSKPSPPCSVVKENTMLIGIVSRMTSQKGFDLVAYIMDELLATEDVQLAVLGTGEDQYQDMFRYFAQKYPDKIQATIGSIPQAHQL